jgi:hypothetical protein
MKSEGIGKPVLLPENGLRRAFAFQETSDNRPELARVCRPYLPSFILFDETRPCTPQTGTFLEQIACQAWRPGVSRGRALLAFFVVSAHGHHASGR